MPILIVENVSRLRKNGYVIRVRACKNRIRATGLIRLNPREAAVVDSGRG